MVYVNEIKTGYAARLLRESKMDIKEIAFESGFENYSNFFRQFKKIQGYTPEKYRNM